KSLVNACDESLRRLQTDYIDLYYVHHWDPHTPVEETMYALNHLVEAGKVRYIAFSDTPAWVTCKAQMIANENHWAPLTAYEMEYNFSERTVETEMMPMAKELGIGVVTWSPLRKGLYSGKYTRENNGNVPGGRLATRYKGQVITEQQFQIIDELLAMAKEYGTTPATVALAWVKSRPANSIPLLGARNIEQLESNLNVLDFVLPKEAADKLSKLSAPPESFVEHDILSENAISMLQTGTTINGWTSKPWPMTPGPDDIRW
ncbi:MAG: aldo/keto reductase, partial [Lachnospiraceae bacterium]|nr:aldo/keto reductase [Lachnospiraceae bacterium]